MFVDNEILPSSIVDMIRASPNLITLDLSLDIYGDPANPKWDIDALFQSVDIAPTTLRFRKAADLDLHAFSDSMKPTPFRSFLLSHHDKITSLALPAPQEDFAHPPSLHLPPDTLPVLREFEGSIYWCCQLSKLQVAAKLESLTVLSARALFQEDKHGVVLEALQAFSSLKALNMFHGQIDVSVEVLKFIVDNAPHLECLTCAFERGETAATIGSQLSCLRLRALAANLLRYPHTIPSEVSEGFVRTLAKHCPALVTVEDLDQRDYRICWVATILRKECGIDLEVLQMQI
ncbi:hypothetical protein BDZ89DRAFT_1063439 [Hymenopellis radicata]|nr:hypothetical protein BDZ89DRAFT_1063439 [Hymenopellis radicata]